MYIAAIDRIVLSIKDILRFSDISEKGAKYRSLMVSTRVYKLFKACIFPTDQQLPFNINPCYLSVIIN